MGGNQSSSPTPSEDSFVIVDPSDCDDTSENLNITQAIQEQEPSSSLPQHERERALSYPPKPPNSPLNHPGLFSRPPNSFRSPSPPAPPLAESAPPTPEPTPAPAKVKSWSQMVQASSGERQPVVEDFAPAYKQRAWKPPSIKIVSVEKPKVENKTVEDDKDVDCDSQYYSLKSGGGHSHMKSIKLRPDEQKRKDLSNQKREMQRNKTLTKKGL
ncbi:hypothetical protein TrLO_g5795 [Triparma laevis f. longispina]|uniref:Uncharacterized protein n=1 Tax=Triparma laevis f. longispina TaxID=1714387 RepID=A0A9W6ZLG7_9STRA|nr:hypothetical protein TrLO_g5795 [Triparma laevis f. longispina]